MKNALVISKKTLRVEERGIALTHAEALEMSRIAECVVMDMAETVEGYHLLYTDGVVRQYDPVTNTIVGPYTEPHRHGGWIS